MISKDTATDIALAYREIETAEALLAEISAEISRYPVPDVRDSFGRPVRGLELAVPSAANSRRLFDVPWPLARPIIEAHIAEKRSKIAILNEKAKIEAVTVVPAPGDDGEIA